MQKVGENSITDKIMNRPKVIILLGGPGSGKGTQGEKIQEEFGYTHLSMGDLMRKTNNHEVDNYNKELSSIKTSSLTHELSLNLLRSAMIEKGWEDGKFVLDGFHRKFDIYDEKLMNEIEIISVIVFAPSSFDILESRIRQRFKENEGREISRKHDLEILQKRLKIYQTETQEVIKYYTSSIPERVYYIDCCKKIEEVFGEIKDVLKLLK